MSEGKKQITGQELQRQVAEYARQQSDYKSYAEALKRVLEKACKTSFPDAFVQAREKSIASFAEKCVRKFGKYPDAVNQMTDLCGGRVIVQTLAQVTAVRLFIEANFKIEEADEKGLLLGEDKFGYRDMHYIVRLIPDKAARLGFNSDEIKAIGDKRAEVQVRTWVQHAWADTLHDRMYKTKLKCPAEFRRAANLLAAIMEDGDRSFDRLAGDIDGMLANFNAYAPREEVEREFEVQQLIHSAADEKRRPEIALLIARLHAAKGEYDRVVSVLSVYENVAPAPLCCAIRLELGFALCKLHRHEPDPGDYREGQRILKSVVNYCRKESLDSVPDLRRRVSTLARALARLAWSYGAEDEDASLARTCYREALELEPGNPYFLSNVVGQEINCLRRREFVGAMAHTLRQGIATCNEHVRNGTEMPYAAFTAGRLHLLLDEPSAALAAYARGIQHVLSCATCVPPDVFAIEEEWLVLVTKPEPLAGGHRWAMDLLRMAGRLQGEAPKQDPGSGALKLPVLIVAGGAASLKPGQAEQLQPMLVEAFTGFAGTIFSGGTRVGVPGCVGDAAEAIGPHGQRPFRLIGYIPRVRPDDAPTDERYDECVKCGEQGFNPEQILKNWSDILDAGVNPAHVRLLGFGGGELSAVEYRVALGLGATVGVVEGSGGAADAILNDDLWKGLSPLLALPSDGASVRAFAHPPRDRFELNAAMIEKMGLAFHEEYVRNSTGRLPDNMKPWLKLKDTFKHANLEQARYAIQILEACGFQVEPAAAPKNLVVLPDFTDPEIERMAEMEHGRWNIDRLLDGWRYGPRNDELKLHNNLVPWKILPDGPDGVKRYDRDAVRKFPEILAQAGLEVRRKNRD